MPGWCLSTFQGSRLLPTNRLCTHLSSLPINLQACTHLPHVWGDVFSAKLLRAVGFSCCRRRHVALDWADAVHGVHRLQVRVKTPQELCLARPETDVRRYICCCAGRRRCLYRRVTSSCLEPLSCTDPLNTLTSSSAAVVAQACCHGVLPRLHHIPRLHTIRAGAWAGAAHPADRHGLLRGGAPHHCVCVCLHGDCVSARPLLLLLLLSGCAAPGA